MFVSLPQVGNQGFHFFAEVSMVIWYHEPTRVVRVLEPLAAWDLQMRGVLGDSCFVLSARCEVGVEEDGPVL